MKTLDRYVVGSFLRNYLISFFVLVGMYVVLDMIFNFDELVEVNTKAGLSGLQAMWNFVRYSADFYFYQIFLYFVHLSGIIPVVAAAFTIMRMTRFNELLALLAAGVPLLRVAAPILVAGAALNVLLWVDQELIIPRIIPKLVRRHDYGADVDWFTIAAMRDDRNARLFAGRYYPSAKPPYMEHVSILELNADGRPLSHIKADKAVWDAAGRQWKLHNGRRDFNLDPAAPAPVQSAPVSAYSSNITPEEIQLYRRASFVELLSTAHINELLNRPMTYARSALLRVKHSRGVAQFLLNMTLLLLAMSALLTREPRHLGIAASRCVFAVGCCLTAAFAAHELAEQTHLVPGLADYWAALMCWMPVLVFGPAGVWLLARLKT